MLALVPPGPASNAPPLVKSSGSAALPSVTPSGDTADDITPPAPLRVAIPLDWVGSDAFSGGDKGDEEDEVDEVDEADVGDVLKMPKRGTSGTAGFDGVLGAVPGGAPGVAVGVSPMDGTADEFPVPSLPPRLPRTAPALCVRRGTVGVFGVVGVVGVVRVTPLLLPLLLLLEPRCGVFFGVSRRRRAAYSHVSLSGH